MARVKVTLTYYTHELKLENYQGISKDPENDQDMYEYEKNFGVAAGINELLEAIQFSNPDQLEFSSELVYD